MDKTEKEVLRHGDDVAIRATLNNMGISNGNIGYNEQDKTVTLGGKPLIKASYVDEDAGVSYAPLKEIQKSLVNYYSGSKNPIVRVSDEYAAAAGKYGIGADALSYGNGTVLIGGKPLNTLFIDGEDKAWAYKDDVDGLLEGYARSSGVKSPNAMAEDYFDEYFSDIKDKLYDLEHRKEFKYNPDDDPVYKAYKEKYQREGERASQNTMANYAALTGGYVNSSAATAGALANQYYAKQLSDVIPELAKQAYERYKDSYSRDVDIVGKMIDAYNKAYGFETEANDRARENANYSASAAIKRDDDAYSRKNAEEEAERKAFNEERELDIKERESNLKNAGVYFDNIQKQTYLEYYNRLLESDIENDKAERAKIYAEISAKYGY